MIDKQIQQQLTADEQIELNRLTEEMCAAIDTEENVPLDGARRLHTDHFVAQSTSPELATDYENLVYSCARCNSIKLDQDVPDPFSVLTANQIQLLPDGRLQGANELANLLIVQLALNSRRLIEWRATWMPY